MGVDDYKTVGKTKIDDFIELAVKGECYIQCAPIEHYTIEELKEISKKAKKNDLVMTIQAEYSNFYQGIMINLLKREDVKKCTKHI